MIASALRGGAYRSVESLSLEPALTQQRCFCCFLQCAVSELGDHEHCDILKLFSLLLDKHGIYGASPLTGTFAPACRGAA